MGTGKAAAASVIVVMIALVAAGFLFFTGAPQLKKDTRRTVEEPPRNYRPMDEYTGFFEHKTLKVNNRIYTYFWYEPERPWPENVNFPMVIILHDGSGRTHAAKFLISGDMPYDYPAFIFTPVIAKNRDWALPGSPGGTLDPEHALPDIIDMIDALAKQYPVDTSRLYIIGCSDGGTGAFGAVRYYPDVFAAAVPVSGSWVPEDGVHMTGVPMWIFHGETDGIIPAEPARMLAGIVRSRGGKAHYSEFKNMGHDCASPLFYAKEMWQWLFSQKR